MIRKTLGISLFLLAIVIGAGAFWLFGYAWAPLQNGPQKSYVFELRTGMGPQAIAEKLSEIGLIDQENHKQWFIVLGRLLRSWGKLRAGEYEIHSRMSPSEVLSVLTSGKSIQYPVTIREGDNIYQVADSMAQRQLCSAADFLLRVKDQTFLKMIGLPPLPSAEGFLFPDTYFFTKAELLDEMIKRMVQRAERAWTPEHAATAQRIGLTRSQVITLASVIEKETGAAEERPIISSVFHNRLKKGMRLQSDPTTIYGIWSSYKGNIHKKDLLKPTPFNTYTVPALPAGPIGNPGADAIMAALHPAKTDYLYFVSKNAGTHSFSKTIEEHNSAVKRYQLDHKAREGKSWRDLKKQSLAN